MIRPTLFLTVGLPGTGKTTAARRIEVERAALRLTKDEWVKALYGHANPPAAQAVIGRTAHPDRGARPRTGHQRRDRFRPLEPRRALGPAAGSSRPRRDDGDALLRTHPR